MNAVVLYILTYKMYLNYKTVFYTAGNIPWNKHTSKRLHIHVIIRKTRQNFTVLRNEGNEIVLGFISKLCFTYVGSNLKSSCLRVERVHITITFIYAE